MCRWVRRTFFSNLKSNWSQRTLGSVVLLDGSLFIPIQREIHSIPIKCWCFYFYFYIRIFLIFLVGNWAHFAWLKIFSNIFRALLQPKRIESFFGRKLVTFYVITSILVELKSSFEMIFFLYLGAHIHLASLCIIRQQQTLTEIHNSIIFNYSAYLIRIYAIFIYVYIHKDWIVPLLTLPNISNIMHAMERSTETSIILNIIIPT